MNNYIQIGDLIKTISKTHKFEKDELIFLNTSDVSTGNILINHYTAISELKGQAKKTIQNGDILYSEIRPKNRRYAYVKNLHNPEDYVVSTKLMVLRNASTKLDTDYLYHFLTSEETINYLQRRAENRIGSFPQITFEVLKKIKIWLPELIIQQKISKVLSDLDAKIELNNKINDNLEQMAKTLYDYWFVQFDFPDANAKPYKSMGGKMVWNEELKRDIPEGWGVNELGNILNTDLGGTPSTEIEKFWGGNIPWLNSGEIANFPIIEAEEHITKEAISNSATTLMPAGTCVLSITRHLRPSILAIDACANQSVVGIFESEKFKSSFIYPYLKNEIPRLMTLRSGAMQPHINKRTVDESLMINPSTYILDKYYIKVNPIYKQIINNSFQNQELASLRDWLLPMLMNGQVSVGEVEEELRMVAEPNTIYQKEEKKIVEKVKKVKVLPIKLNPVDVYKRTLLAAEIVFQLKDTHTLGHLKLQKMLYLCQEIENMSLPMNFLKQAMGPYDNQLARSLDKQFLEKKWFTYQKGEPLKYKPLENCGKHKEDFQKYFETEAEQINYLINKFKKFTSNQIEAVATLYACWKEAIEKKELITDKLIITKFYQWSKEKEKFREDNLIKALDWMRRNSIEPK